MKLTKLKKIYLASPRGFCAGVERAVKIVDLLLQKYGPPIYVKHQIVHNRHVVSDFENKGIIFVEDLTAVPDSSITVFSAHGSAPYLRKEAKKKKLKVYDAVCPLVTKVHLEAKRYEREGYFIFYIGHKGHPEPIGVLGEIPAKSAVLIDSLKEAKKVKPPQIEKLIILTQTTLSFDDTKDIINILKARFSKLILPPAFDICYATQNRQNAVKELAKKVEVILVVGSKESSNSNRLKEVAEKEGVIAYLIDSIEDIKKEWLKNIEILGVTAGASAPTYVVKNLIHSLATNKTEIKELHTIPEKIHFPLRLESTDL